MVITDPIADMLSRIRNAMMVGQTEVLMPYSKQKDAVAQQLVKSKFLKSAKADGKGIEKQLKISITTEGQNPNITMMERISKPGRRVYAKADEIPVVKNGRGIVIVSTSKGVMSGDDAKKARIGGELICKVY